MGLLDWLSSSDDTPPHFDRVAMMAIGTLVEDIGPLKPNSGWKVFHRRLEKLEAVADILQTHKRLPWWGGAR